MRSIDAELVKKIKQNVDWILEEQKKTDSYYHKDARKLPIELHGPLVEYSDLDKEDNTTLIDFLIALIYAREDRTHEETLKFLQDLSVALGKMGADGKD